MSDAFKVVGAFGSPYTRKLQAYLRYKRIPFQAISQRSVESQGLPQPRIPIIPYLIYPHSSEALTDTTPLIQRLEAEHSARPVVPASPAIAFLNALIEDFADEWLTKAMFHYRWNFAPDIEKAGALIPIWGDTTIAQDKREAMSDYFSQRQIARLYVVGSNEITGPIIEQSYERILRCLDACLRESRFLLGAAPASCDFAVYGQLTQLTCFDPTSSELAVKIAPRVVSWTQNLDDISGLEAPLDTMHVDSLEAVSTSIKLLLAEIGVGYVPVMLANYRAIRGGAEQVECEVGGQLWRQPPFPYQAKCLDVLKSQYSGLPDSARSELRAFLQGVNCGNLVRLFDE
jgi:glutathione S-transferase